MRVAFKEWAVMVEALGAGQQIIILRKGGISEGRRGFQVEHAEFVLFPTVTHQGKNMAVDTAPKRGIESTVAPANESHVRLQYFAHVVSWRRLESLATAERLRGQHIWRDEVVAERFEWGKEKHIYALAVRVFRLPQPVMLPVIPGYGGCKSWIHLDTEVPTDGATPVLSKEAFNEKLNQFHTALDSEGSSGPLLPASSSAS
jgi:hypothetical protein